MGLFEYLGERQNPGGIGTTELRKIARNRQPAPWVWGKFVVAIALIVGALVASFVMPEEPSLKTTGIAAGALFLYTVLSTLVRVEPDYGNMGHLGGLVDDRRRISDDINRLKLSLMVLMLPGLFLGTAFTDVFWWIADEEE